MTGPVPNAAGAGPAVRAGTAHGFAHLFVPAAPGAPLAGLTVLALHGTGGDEHDLVPLAGRVAPGAAVLSPRGPVLEQGMPRFFRRLAEGVFDLDDLARRTEQLGDFVDAAARDYGVDRARVVAVGFSNGANVAASLLLRRPGALAGAAAPAAAPNARPVVTVAAGRADPLVPRAQPGRLAELLAAAGCDARVEWVDAGHQLVARDLDLAADVVRRAGGG